MRQALPRTYIQCQRATYPCKLPEWSNFPPLAQHCAHCAVTHSAAAEARFGVGRKGGAGPWLMVTGVTVEGFE